MADNESVLQKLSDDQRDAFGDQSVATANVQPVSVDAEPSKTTRRKPAAKRDDEESPES